MWLEDTLRTGGPRSSELLREEAPKGAWALDTKKPVPHGNIAGGGMPARRHLWPGLC